MVYVRYRIDSTHIANFDRAILPSFQESPAELEPVRSAMSSAQRRYEEMVPVCTDTISRQSEVQIMSFAKEPLPRKPARSS